MALIVNLEKKGREKMDCKTQNISLKRADAAFIAHISEDYYKFTLTSIFLLYMIMISWDNYFILSEISKIMIWT